MPSTSKSNQRKPKKRRQPRRNWLELQADVTTNILYRVGVFDLLENVQGVCTTWRKICKDPAMWKVIYLNAEHLILDDDEVRAMCKHVVDRSQSQLIDITMVNFCDDELFYTLQKVEVPLAKPIVVQPKPTPKARVSPFAAPIAIA